MRILALDTSTEWCSVAAGDGIGWFEEKLHAHESHSQHVLPMIERALAVCGYSLANVDGIAFGAGPGSFTGLRIACGVAQGLALGADLPVLPVGTLHAIAFADGRDRIVASLDARMREIYIAAYERRGPEYIEIMAPDVVAPERATRPDGVGWCGAGNGFAIYPSLVSHLAIEAVDDAAVPSARAIGAIALPRLARGDTVSAADALPVYIRHRVALTTEERAAGAML